MPLQFPVIIRRKLDRLERSLRFYAALDGIALLLFTVISLFLLNFALDRFFEFPLATRAVLLPMVVGTILYVFWLRIIRRCFAVVRRDQLATVLEHFIPNLNESLITAVDWADNEEFDPELMQYTINEAAAALRGVTVSRFLRTDRVLGRLTFSIVFAVLVVAYFESHFSIVRLWFSRNVLLSQEEYPRRSHLLADGFQEGRIRIGRGDPFTLVIRASMERSLVPETVRVRIGTSVIGYRTLVIDQFRTETREGTRWRVFSTTFPEMLETVALQIRGADSTLNDLCVEVVPTPTLTEMMLSQKFPDYMQRPDRVIALTGQTMIPEGTTITITAKSTKPLAEATAIVNQTEISLHMQNFPADGTTSAPPSEGCRDSDGAVPFNMITLTLPALREETIIDFRLRDIDSLTNRHPIRAELRMIKDQPPVVTARLEGIGSAITPEAVLPIIGEITDDNGLSAATHRYITEPAPNEPPRESAEGTVPIPGIHPGQTVFPLKQTFAVSPLAVQPNDKLILSVEASDLFDLDLFEGQIGTGPRWLLEIVTAEKLKNLLETREIALRQRFEVIIGEVERTKNMLTDYSVEPTEPQIRQAAALTLDSKEGVSEEERQRELEAKKKKIRDTIGLEQSELGRYHISRMLRDTQKEVYDLIGIVESFRGIRQEMINNRIFSEDEQKRINQEIMLPIQELINTDFPGIDQLLGMLNQLLSEHDEPKRPSVQTERQNILDKFDATLLKMTAIRDKMASMESFNEAIELLRSILKQQQQLRNETIEERNKRLKDLLD